MTEPTGRRTVVKGVVVGGLTLPLLAACGVGSSGGSGTSSGPAKVPTAKVPVGGGYIDDSAKVVVTQPSAGEYKAFSAVCTHQGCIVSKVENRTIDCLCHGSEFSIVDGSVKQGPATQPLPGKKATVSGGTVVVA